MQLPEQKAYLREECVVFLKTTEPFGGLSNMASGYPLKVNGIDILTSEALYQACRFPHRPEVQKLIIDQRSPMTAKMKSKPHRKDSRSDWEDENVYIMWWSLRVKLAQNWEKFKELLLSTGNRSIVEESRRDPFWGAKPVDAQTLVGRNILGRSLVQLRDKIRTTEADELRIVKPLPIKDFLLYGNPIGIIGYKAGPELPKIPISEIAVSSSPFFDTLLPREQPAQPSLF